MIPAHVLSAQGECSQSHGGQRDIGLEGWTKETGLENKEVLVGGTDGTPGPRSRRSSSGKLEDACVHGICDQ